MASKVDLSADRRSAAGLDPDLSLLPSGALGSTLRRQEITSAAVAYATSGRLEMTGLWLPEGVTVTNLVAMSGSTAGATLTHAWYALYDQSRNLLRATADDTAASWVANTVKSLALSSTFTTTYSGLHYLGLVVVGTTMPTFMGNGSLGTTVNAIAPILHGSSTTGLVAPATAPNPAAAISNLANIPWMWCT